MKVVLVSVSDLKGGAAKAAYRLHQALLSRGVDCQMVVQRKFSDDPTVLGPDSKLKKKIDALRPAADHIVMKFTKNKSLFSTSYLPYADLIKRVNDPKPDIVHLHWVTGGTIRIEDLNQFNAPIVWTCHDMWPFTGGCHYDENCGAYTKNCGNCVVLQSNKTNDLSSRVFARKMKTYSQIKSLFVVASSKWIHDCAKKSHLFKDRKILNIPNCLDTEMFRNIDKIQARKHFDIPQDKKVILFGAVNSLTDTRKGAKELLEAIALLKNEPFILVIAGSNTKKNQNYHLPTYHIPPIYDANLLPLMYNLADVVVIPSLQENFANSILESLSCGVPVVAFDIGGNQDMIDHQKNGYLAQPFIPEDMAKGIKFILNAKNYQERADLARKKVLDNFNQKIIADQFIELYQEVADTTL